ncbi:MAG: hypothetical protein ACO1QB_16325 [Verrucomicrobiales bacterium]
MKRVLKDLKTGLYLRSMDEWTAHPEQAYFFRDVFQALKFCEEHHLGEIAIIGRSNDDSERVLAFRHAASSHRKTQVPIPSQKASEPAAK